MKATVRQVADGTYLVHGTSVNWVILTEGGRRHTDRHRLPRRP